MTNPLASEQTEEEKSLRTISEIPRSAVTYYGTGSVMGGQKLRHGFLELNGCWVIIVRERGDAKEPLNVGQCSFLRSDKIAKGRSLEIIPAIGKNVVLALGTAPEREQWLDTLAICRRLLDEAIQSGNGALSPESRFGEIIGWLVPMGKLQLVCTGGRVNENRNAPSQIEARNVAHAVARMPLTIHQPHFEVLVRALPENTHFSIGVKLDTTARKGRGMVGWAENELGVSSYGELATGPGKSRRIFFGVVVGTRLGCGIGFDASKERCIYFSFNGSVAATIPCPKGAMPRPVIAAFGKGTRLEVALGLPTLPDVESFSCRCSLKTKGGHLVLVCSKLEDAISRAKEDDVVSLAAGVYFLEETIVINKRVTIRALESGKVTIYKRNGGIAVQCDADGVVLAGLCVQSHEGDINAKFSERNFALGILVHSGACRLETCDVQCSCGTGVIVMNGKLQCEAGSSIGPCGRNGVILYSQAEAVLHGTVIKNCMLWCFCLRSGCSAELVGCNLLNGKQGGLICTSERNPSPALCSLTGSTIMGDTDKPQGDGIFLDGAGCTASAVGCTIAGFSVVAKASGRDAKMTIRACKLAQSNCCFNASQNCILAHVDCHVQEVNTMKVESEGGRVVDFLGEINACHRAAAFLLLSPCLLPLNPGFHCSISCCLIYRQSRTHICSFLF